MNTLSQSPHLKLQEMCDCYLDTDFSKKLAAMKQPLQANIGEDACKYLALALLEATTEQAQELSLVTMDNLTTVTVETAEKSIPLPTPAPEIAHSIITIIRDITHLDDGNGKGPLILGLKTGQLDLSVMIQKRQQAGAHCYQFSWFRKQGNGWGKTVVADECKADAEIHHWKCGQCNYTFTAPRLPEQCPDCGEKCDFLNITCYTPECGGPGNIDPRLV